MGDNQPDITRTASSLPKRIPSGGIPDVKNNDVFISVEGTVEKIKNLLNAHGVMFVRAAVASGKTTLAQYMVRYLSGEFVQIIPADSPKGWCQAFVEASGREDLLEGDDLLVAATDALEEIGKQGKTCVVDEAHILFEHPEVTEWIKHSRSLDPPPKILLFSAAATAENGGKMFTTPPEIKKYMWYPPIPAGGDLVQPLKDAGVHLSAESVDFFMKLCSGRRGIFMHAMDWVKQQQEGLTDNAGWDIAETVSRVREAMESRRELWGLHYYLQQSRAVRVNGRFIDLDKIPEEFVQVLYGGPKTKAELNKFEHVLTVAGFLIPERRHMGQEFEPCDWTCLGVRCTISCSIMADHYKDRYARESDYGFELIPQKRFPSSAADLLARVVPFLSFMTVVGNPIPVGGNPQSSLSSDGMPCEQNYNDAIHTILSNTLKYDVSKPQGASGKTGVTVMLQDEEGNMKKCAIESIMALRDNNAHLEHAERFFNPQTLNYEEAHFKALVIIGSSTETVRTRMSHVKTVKDRKSHVGENFARSDLEIVGLVHAPAFDSYEMLLFEDDKLRQYVFVCDNVAKSLENGDLPAAQRLVKRGRPDETTTTSATKRAREDGGS